MFNHASSFIISSASFVDTKLKVENTALQHLSQHVAPGASHESKEQYEKPKCLSHTRTQLLIDIHEWIKVQEKTTGIMFLHGATGSGKSCIARSVCERADKEGLLGASFFFSRDSSARNNESRLITTLAYQLAKRDENIKRYIISELARNPHIVEMPLEVQFRNLIADPCYKIPREDLRARVIVIDGLDECMGEEIQIGVLHMLAKAVRFEGFPLGFFVTSRPELHLQESLNSKEVIFATNIISLNRISGVTQDTRTVLESGFNDMLNNPEFKGYFKSVPRPWPTPEDIDTLVRRARGQMIYAATVLKFISSPDHNPVSQLNIVLDNVELEAENSSTPPLFEDLDRLYHQIMSAVPDPHLTLKVLGYVIAIKSLSRKRILTRGDLNFSPDITRAVLHNQNRLFLVVDQLLGLSDGVSYIALKALHSVVSLAVGSESTRRHLEIKFHHKSFQDFLTTKKRSTTFYVNLNNAHFDVAQSCLKFMGLNKYETEAQHFGWIYSCFQWNLHLAVAKKKLNVTSIDSALRNLFSAPSFNLNTLHLNLALEVMGLPQLPSKSKIVEKAVFNMQTFGRLSWEDLVHAVCDVRATIYNLCQLNDITSFDRNYAYPVWRHFFQTYGNDLLLKYLLLVLSVADDGDFVLSGDETYRVLHGLGLAEGSLSISQLTDISNLVISKRTHLSLRIFLNYAEHSGSFHCTANDYTNLFNAFISSGVWRSHLNGFCMQWKNLDENVVANDSLLSCLKSESSKFLQDDDLRNNLTEDIKHNLLFCLQKKLQGKTKGVISAWKKTFLKSYRF